MLAYVEMFGRDKQKLKNNFAYLRENPLGSGALSGTSFNIDRNFTTKKLGFKVPTKNSIDTVSNITGASKKATREALKTADDLTKKSTIKKTFKDFGKGAAAATAGKDITKEFGKGTLKGSGGEGLTEAGQEVVQIASAAVAGDKTA